MTTFADSLTTESVDRLYTAFQAGIQLSENEKGNHTINRRKFPTIGPSLLRYVHHRLLSSAVLDPHPPDHLFPYKAKETITGILRDELGNEADVSSMVGDLGRLMKVNRMAHILPGGGGIWVGHHIPADEDMKYEPWKAGRFDPKEEKRIEQEADKVIVTTRDLRSIKLPSSDPASVMEFIERFVPAALKVQDEAKSLKDEVRELKALLAETIEAADKAQENGQWASAADRVKDLMSSGS